MYSVLAPISISFCCIMLHAWSNSTPMVSISSCWCLISNLLSKHGVEHDSLLQFPSSLISCSCSRKQCSFIHVFLSYGRMSCAYLIYLCILHAFHLMVLFMAPILLFSIFLCHEFNI